MLELTGISKRYAVGGQQVQALDSVSLKFDKGTFSSIVGPSGAGKSTLLHTISGIVKASKGRVYYQGTDITHMAPEKIGISTESQTVLLHPCERILDINTTVV